MRREEIADHPRRGIRITERQLEIIAELAKGLSNEEIGVKLFISADTVKAHVFRIIRQLGAKNRTEAVAIAYQQGYLVPERRDDLTLRRASERAQRLLDLVPRSFDRLKAKNQPVILCGTDISWWSQVITTLQLVSALRPPPDDVEAVITEFITNAKDPSCSSPLSLPSPSSTSSSS